MSARELALEIKRMAMEYEDPQKLAYSAHNEWSFPAYLMLDGWWNDALNWADETLKNTGAN